MRNCCVVAERYRGRSLLRLLCLLWLPKGRLLPLVPKLQFGNALWSETPFRMAGVSAGGERLELQTTAARAGRLTYVSYDEAFPFTLLGLVTC
jgi:hypothetical protein